MKKNGFTLVELMIVIAILGIIASIAVPSYNSYVAETKTTEAKSNLHTIRLAEEQYYSDYGQYTSDLALLKSFQPGPASMLNYNYTINVTNNGAAFYAKATSKSDATKYYTINQENMRLDQDGKEW